MKQTNLKTQCADFTQQVPGHFEASSCVVSNLTRALFSQGFSSPDTSGSCGVDSNFENLVLALLSFMYSQWICRHLGSFVFGLQCLGLQASEFVDCHFSPGSPTSHQLGNLSLSS